MTNLRNIENTMSHKKSREVMEASDAVYGAERRDGFIENTLHDVI